MFKNPFITDQSQVIAPSFLLSLAKKNKKRAKVAIAYSQSASSIIGAKHAYDEGLIEPVFVGNKSIVERETSLLKWDISNYRIVEVDNEEEAGDLAAAICGNGEADILMKGDLHSDVFMRSVISRKNNLRTKNKIVHQFYITPKNGGKGVIISDAAVNIKPSESTLKTITEQVCNSLRKLNQNHPKIAFLSASETVMENM